MGSRPDTPGLFNPSQLGIISRLHGFCGQGAQRLWHCPRRLIAVGDKGPLWPYGKWVYRLSSHFRDGIGNFQFLLLQERPTYTRPDKCIVHTCRRFCTEQAHLQQSAICLPTCHVAHSLPCLSTSALQNQFTCPLGDARNFGKGRQFVLAGA